LFKELQMRLAADGNFPQGNAYDISIDGGNLIQGSFGEMLSDDTIRLKDNGKIPR
jgi:hypothetical protein